MGFAGAVLHGWVVSSMSRQHWLVYIVVEDYCDGILAVVKSPLAFSIRHMLSGEVGRGRTSFFWVTLLAFLLG